MAVSTRLQVFAAAGRAGAPNVTRTMKAAARRVEAFRRKLQNARRDSDRQRRARLQPLRDGLRQAAEAEARWFDDMARACAAAAGIDLAAAAADDDDAGEEEAVDVGLAAMDDGDDAK